MPFSSERAEMSSRPFSSDAHIPTSMPRYSCPAEGFPPNPPAIPIKNDAKREMTIHSLNFIKYCFQRIAPICPRCAVSTSSAESRVFGIRLSCFSPVPLFLPGCHLPSLTTAANTPASTKSKIIARSSAAAFRPKSPRKIAASISIQHL